MSQIWVYLDSDASLYMILSTTIVSDARNAPVCPDQYSSIPLMSMAHSITTVNIADEAFPFYLFSFFCDLLLSPYKRSTCVCPNRSVPLRVGVCKCFWKKRANCRPSVRPSGGLGQRLILVTKLKARVVIIVIRLVAFRLTSADSGVGIAFFCRFRCRRQQRFGSHVITAAKTTSWEWHNSVPNASLDALGKHGCYVHA